MTVMEQGYILDFGAMWFSTWGTLISYNRLPNPTPRVPVLDRPLCPKCAQLMWLALIEPDKPNRDRRTFECWECDYTETIVVKYR